MNMYDKITQFGWEGLKASSAQPAGGEVFFVDGNSGNAANSAVSGQGGSWDMPFSTVNYAISRCSNNAGNVIFVAANHTETIADTNDDNVSGTTTDEFCVDKSGVTIIGLGAGTRRPTFTLATATDACIDIQAANCALYNLVFYNTIADNVAMLDAQATADGLIIENCKFYESANDAESIIQVLLSANCDDVVIRGCRFYNVAANDGGLASIKLEGGSDRLKLYDNIWDGDWNEQLIDGDTAASTEIEIIDNIFNSIDATYGAAIDLHSGSTGVIKGNHIHCPLGSNEGPIEADGCLISDNWSTRNEGQDTRRVIGRNATDNICNEWYVDSGQGVAGADAKSWDTAEATIEAAIQLCTANNGDIIHVAPGHEDTMTDSVLIDFDIAGITLLGHGNGSNKPLITYDHTAAFVTIDANNITIKNINFRPSVSAVVKGIILAAGADHFHISDCDFGHPEETTDEFAIAILTGDASNEFVIENCRFMAGAQAAVVAIDIVTDTDHSVIRNCTFTGAYSVCPIRGQTTASTYLDIGHNLFMTTGATDTFNLMAASTGMVHDNRIVVNAADFAVALDIGNCWNINNFMIADADVTGATCDNRYTAAASVTETADG